jgi:glutamine cyclotransferase
LPFGGRLVIAKIYKGGTPFEVTTNIQVLPSSAPKQLSYAVVNVFPHDTTSYTEGLQYVDRVLYESDGEYAQSSLRKTDLKSGKILQKIEIPPRFFAEGIAVIDNKIIMLTWKEGVGFVYDKNSFKQLKEFSYTAGNEGWGLTYDGKQIYNTDGSNNIYILDKNTYQKKATIEVYDNKGPVNQLNELEYIDGKLLANVYQTDKIVIINPQTGGVEAEVDLSKLYPQPRNEHADVLNGIAWDAAGKRLFVTGKKWDKLYEIKIK